MGMDFVTFTDHDTLSAFDLLDEMKGVVTGVEIKIKDMEMVGHTIHINVYDLNGEQFHELKEISGQGDLSSFIDYLVRNDLPYIYNHPLWFERKEKPNFAAIPDLVKLFPVLEYNMHRLGPKNEITMALARQYGKGLAASTDCHAGEVGMVYTLSRGDSFREFFENICRGESFLVVKELTKQEVLQEINRWIELIFSPDIWDHSRKCSMGVGYLDRILKALSSNTLKSSPRMGRAVYKLSQKISNSGLPAWMYLRTEGSSLSEIESQLSMILR
jgi:predicted metal-dependent phosphoesterase TrpH